MRTTRTDLHRAPTQAAQTLSPAREQHRPLDDSPLIWLGMHWTLAVATGSDTRLVFSTEEMIFFDEELLAQGMAFASEPPAFPDREAFGLTLQDPWMLEGDAAGQDAYWAERRRRLTQGVAGKTGIPLHKLDSRDEWLIRPDEIAGALAVAAEQPLSSDDDYHRRLWQAFLGLLREAAANGVVVY